MENKEHDNEIAAIRRHANLVRTHRERYYWCVRIDLSNGRFPTKSTSMFQGKEGYLPLDKWDSTPDP